jgi:hypothetical protein
MSPRLCVPYVLGADCLACTDASFPQAQQRSHAGTMPRSVASVQLEFEPLWQFRGVPKAEVCARRYNPFVQARGRVDQLRRLGHSVDKVEYILMGGTFMSLPLDYRDFFVRNLHDALSGHSSSSVHEAVRSCTLTTVWCLCPL